MMWDLMENPRYGCDLVPFQETKPVQDFLVDFATFEIGMYPTADECDITFQCRIEEPIDPGMLPSTPWFRIPEDLDALYYITRKPVEYLKSYLNDAGPLMNPS